MKAVCNVYQTFWNGSDVGGTNVTVSGYGHDDDCAVRLGVYHARIGSIPGMTNVEASSDLLKPFDARLMRSYVLRNRINQVQDDDPECGRPVEPEASPQGQLF
jgi:hypothetical protein